jgi:hypothetical protein
MANSEDYSFEGEREGHISKQQAKPIGKRGYYKTPVQETALPTTEMTKKSEAQIATNSTEKGFNNNVHVPLESGDRTSNNLKEHTRTAPTQGALTTAKQPHEQTFPVKTVPDSIREGEKDTAKSTIGAKTIIEAHFELQPRQDQAAEPLLSVPSGQLERQVGQEEGSGLDNKNGGQEELPVYGVGASKQNANHERTDLPYSGDYLYPLTVSMALWQDFALSAIRVYNECARELSKINGNWMNIFLGVWRESSNTDKKSESE